MSEREIEKFIKQVLETTEPHRDPPQFPILRATVKVFEASPQDAEQNERDAEVTMETDNIISSHPQVLGTAVSMVTQEGTTIAGRQVAMVTDGKELQPFAIVTSDGIMTEVNLSLYQQVALLATENGTQIAVQRAFFLDNSL